MTTYIEALKQIEAEARETQRDVATARKLWKAADGSREELREMAVEFLTPGSFPKLFPGPTTAEDRAAGMEWDERWKIYRIADQPAAERISIPAGKFLPGGMPDIQFDD